MKLNRVLLAKAAGLESIDPAVGDCLQAFADSVFITNQKINLVSRAGDVEVEVAAQLAISVATAPLVRQLPSVSRCIDVGSGGGFPAIPLAILNPGIRFILIEATAKKAYFLERTAQELGIRNVSAVHSRFEDRPPEQCDLLVLKAVTQIETSFQWGSRSCRVEGYLLTYRPSPPADAWKESAERYGFEQIDTLQLKTLLDIDNLEIVVFQKRR